MSHFKNSGVNDEPVEYCSYCVLEITTNYKTTKRNIIAKDGYLNVTIVYFDRWTCLENKEFPRGEIKILKLFLDLKAISILFFLSPPLKGIMMERGTGLRVEWTFKVLVTATWLWKSMNFFAVSLGRSVIGLKVNLGPDGWQLQLQEKK